MNTKQIIEMVLMTHEKEVKEYLEGTERMFGFFVGQVMRESNGRANPGTVNLLLRRSLAKIKTASAKPI